MEHRHLQFHRTALYRFFASDGTLLYVGITNDLVVRWKQHAASAAWWHLQARNTVEWFEMRYQAEAAEREAIKSEHPKWNVTHAGVLGRYVPERRKPREKADPEGMRSENLIDHKAAAARLAELAAALDVANLPFRRERRAPVRVQPTGRYADPAKIRKTGQV